MITIPISFPVDPNAEELLSLISNLVSETNTLRKSMLDLPIDEMRKKQEHYATTIGQIGIEIRKKNQNQEEEQAIMLEMKNTLELYIDKMEVAIKAQKLLNAENEKSEKLLNSLSKETVKATNSIIDLKDKIAEYNKVVQEGGKLTSTQESQIEKWTEKINLAGKVIQENAQILAIYNSRTKESAKEMEIANGYIEQMKEEIKELTKARNALSKEELESSKLGKEYSARLSDLNSKLAQYQKQVSGTLEFENALNKVRNNNIILENRAIATLEADIDVMAQAKIANKELSDAIENRVSVLTTGMTLQEIAFDKAWKDGKEWQRKQEEIFDKAWIAGEEWQKKQALSFDRAWIDGQEWQKKQEEIFNKAWEDSKKHLENEKKSTEARKRLFDEQIRKGELRADEMNRLYRAEDGSIVKLKTHLEQMIERWNSMGSASRAANASVRDEIIKTKNELAKLDAELKEVKASSNMEESADSLSNYLTQLISIYTVVEGIRKAFDVALKFDAIEKSLFAISKNANEAAFNFEYLRKISSDLGLDFETMVGSYKQFSAALTNTNLEGQRTRDIFSSVSKAATVMKLPMDSVEGVFLALEQIVSKGQVSMEELRKQLGNRLPGAFALFAEGLGLSTKELNEFMKEGRITKDALVPFAEILEKKFGGKVKEVTDSLPASLNRMNNAFKQMFQKDSVIDFFNTFIKLGTKFAEFASGIFSDKSDNMIRDMQKYNETFKDNSDQVSKLLLKYDELKVKTNLTKEENYELQTTLNSISSILPGLVTGFDEYGNALDINRDKVEKFMKSQGFLADAMKKRTLSELSNEINKSSKTQKTNSKILESYRGFLQKDPNQLNPAFTKEGAFTEYGESLFKELNQAESEIIEKSVKILELGGKLDAAQINILNKINTGEDESLRLTQEKAIRVMAINNEIQRESEQRIKLVGSKQKNAELRREILANSIKSLELERQEILHPGTTKRGEINPFQDPTKNGPKGPNLFIKDMRIAKEQYETLLKETKEVYDKNNPNNTYDDDIELQKKNIKLAKDHYKRKLEIIKQYSGTKDLHEKDEVSQLEDAENKRLGIENKSSEAINKIIEDRRKRFEDAVRDIDAYNQQMKKADEGLSKLIAKYEDFKQKAESQKRVAINVNLLAAMIGVEDKKFSFDEQQKQYDKSIKESESYLNKLKENRDSAEKRFSEFSIESSVLGMDIKGSTDAEKLSNDKKGSFKIKLEQAQKESKEVERLNMEMLQQETSQAEIEAQKILDIETRKADAKKELYRSTYLFGEQLMNSAFEANRNRIKQAMEMAQANADFEMQIAGNNEYGKERIARRAHNQMMSLKKKEAKAEKNQAVFTATLNTLAAATASLMKYPLPLGAPILAMNLATGFSQVVAISSQKPPAYFKGKKKGEGSDEVARINERGFELVERDNRFIVFSKGEDTYAPIKKSDKIHTHHESLKIIEKDKELKNLLMVQRIATDAKERQDQKIIINQNNISVNDMEKAMTRALKSAPPVVLQSTPKSVMDRSERQRIRNGL